jgi:hypothetical protein
MGDYVYPSVFFSYFVFFLVTAGAVYFCVRTASHGYWGPDGEDAKYRMLADDEETDHGRS